MKTTKIIKGEPQYSTMKIILSLIIGLAIIIPSAYAVSSLSDTTLNVPTVNATEVYQNGYACFTQINTGTRYVQVGNTSDIQAEIDLCSGSSCLVYVPAGTYNNVGQINLTSGVRLIGTTERGTLFNCLPGVACIKAKNNVRIYDIEVSNIQLAGANGVNSIGIDTTNISTGRFDTMTINNFNIAVYGNGLNYYNDYYHLIMSGNNYTVWLQGASNAHNFYGGSFKNAVTEALKVDASNQISFFGTSWEGNAESFNITNGGRNIAFMANRFEFTGAATMNFASTSFGNTLIGGLMDGVTINDLGTGNQILMTDYAYHLGFRGNSKTTLTITDNGSGQTAQTPALKLIKSYSPSGSPSGLAIELARAGGNYVNFTQAGTQKFVMETTGKTTWNPTQLTGPAVIINATGSSANNATNPSVLFTDTYTGGGNPTVLSLRAGKEGETFNVQNLTGGTMFAAGLGNSNRAYMYLLPAAFPPSTPTPSMGMMYTDTSGSFCWYNGTSWNNLVNRSLDASCA